MEYNPLEEISFETEEDKKLFFLTKHNTSMNKSFPNDIEKAADKVYRDIYGSPKIKSQEIKKRKNKSKDLKVKFNEEVMVKIF